MNFQQKNDVVRSASLHVSVLDVCELPVSAEAKPRMEETD